MRRRRIITGAAWRQAAVWAICLVILAIVIAGTIYIVTPPPPAIP
jgi:hypothetical protein